MEKSIIKKYELVAYFSIFIYLIVFMYLILKLFGIVKSLEFEQIFAPIVLAQLFYNGYTIRALKEIDRKLFDYEKRIRKIEKKGG